MNSENDLQLHPLTDPGKAQLRWEVTMVGCLYAGYAGLTLCRTAVPIAAPAMIADPTLGLDGESFGALLGWGAGGALAGKLLCGIAADHFGCRRLFLFAITLQMEFLSFLPL